MKHCVNRSRERKCNGILPAVKNHKIGSGIWDLGSIKKSELRVANSSEEF